MEKQMRNAFGLLMALAIAAFGVVMMPQPAQAEEITKFEVTGVRPPVAGAEPSWGFSIPSAQGYTKAGSSWYEGSEVPGDFTALTNQEHHNSSKTLSAFTEGKYYTFVAFLGFDSGVSASNTATAEVNGVEGNWIESGGAIVWRTFYCESGTAIDETNFPDAVFRAYVKSNFDKNKNDILSSDEADAVTEVNVFYMSICDLKGIERFGKLEELYCFRNGISSLDVSGNHALKELGCSNTDIASLDVSGNPALERLYCYGTKITSLDVSKNPVLEILNCSYTNITSLDVSKNPALEVLNCSYTNIASLDVSKNHALKELGCSSTNITSLDLSGDPALERLYCNDCPKLESVFLGRDASLLAEFKIDEGVTVIEAPLALEAGKVKLASSSLTYTGKALKPAVTVKGYAGTKLAEGTDYTVSYKANKSVGTATVTVIGTGNYKGIVAKPFSIVPAAPKATAPKAGKKALTAKWKKAAGAAGYQVSYSTSKKFSKKSTKTAKVKGAKAVSKKLAKLKGGKRYYVKVRAYKVVNGKTYYSAWSSVKSVKTKK